MAVSQSLSVTEASVNTADNTSEVRILWQSTQTGTSHNDYTKTAKYYVSTGIGAEKEYYVSYTLPANSTKTIVDITITVAHSNDGSGTVRVRTWMDTGINAGVVQKSKTVSLTTIPRASTITSAYAVTLGSRCKIMWTPASASFYYKVKFAIGSWSYTTEAFKPGVTSAYTYTGYPIPMDVASNFPDNPSGTMTATLYTYSDSGTTQVGSESSKPFAVTLPENESTMPTIRMTLSPVTPYKKFESLYLQGISKVKATFEGEGKYGASIVAYSLQAEGGRYIEPYTSNILAQSGESTIVGFVSDSRWFGNYTTQKINVIAYDAPYISPSSGYKQVICERCKADGTADDSGTYLHVKGKRYYTKINTDGIVNTCSVRCRYKAEGGTWSHASGAGRDVLASTNTSTDEFDVILDGIVSDVTLTYTVELSIIDDTNIPSVMVFNIPSEDVAFHLRDGGGGAAFGKYAITKELLECVWDAKFHKGLSIHSETVADFVVEQGLTDIWYYRKWYSGKAECWGRRAVSVNISTKWETIYYNTVDKYAFPSGLFTYAPMCQVTAEFGSTMQAAWLGVGGEASKDYTPGVIFCRPNIAEAGFDILYYAIGNWK